MVRAKSLDTILLFSRTLFFHLSPEDYIVRDELEQGQILEFAEEDSSLDRQRNQPHLHENEELKEVHQIPQILESEVKECLQDEHTSRDASHSCCNRDTELLHLRNFFLRPLWLHIS